MEKQLTAKPVIRFPEFTDHWNNTKLSELLKEAKKRNMIRGQIIKGSSIQKEKTNFRGDHVVECYIVQNNIVVAKDRIHVPISEGVH